MSEQENLQLAERMIAAFNARDFDRFSQELDPGFTQESEFFHSIRGGAAALEAIEVVLNAFPDLYIDVEQMSAGSSHVVVRAQLEGTHQGAYAGIAPTKTTVSWRWCNVIEVRNGKAIRSTIYADNATLLQQLGVISIPRVAAAA